MVLRLVHGVSAWLGLGWRNLGEHRPILALSSLYVPIRRLREPGNGNLPHRYGGVAWSK
jgi:hypothetical protein